MITMYISKPQTLYRIVLKLRGPDAATDPIAIVILRMGTQYTHVRRHTCAHVVLALERTYREGTLCTPRNLRIESPPIISPRVGR